jgi:hypothetical protein
MMKRSDKGQVLVLVALCLFVLLGLAALGIDVGYMYSVRHELQRCADSGALAGASVFRATDLDSTNPAAQDLARERATDYATRDEVTTSRLNTVPGDVVLVTFPTTPNLRRVRVEVHRTAPLFFARVLGRNDAVITAFAVAEAFPVTSHPKCIVPWGIPAPWTNNPPGDNSYTTGDQVNWPVVESDCDNKAITPWDYVNHVAGTPTSTIDQYLCQGSLQTLKIGDSQSSSISGNFFGVDFSQYAIPSDSCPADNINSGANFYQFMIENPCACELNIDLNANLPAIPTEPGMMVGPTLKATAPDSYTKAYGGDIPGQMDANSLMNQDPYGYWDPVTNLPNSSDSRYSDNNWARSPRVVRIPVYHPDSNFNGGLNTPSGGSNPFQPLGFYGFWVQDIVYIDKDPVTNKQLGMVVGRFVTVEGVGGGESEGEGTVFNIRLVE